MTHSPEQRLTMRKLDLDSTNIIVYPDGSFQGNKDASSQVGYIIFLCYQTCMANLIYYSSIKWRRVVR